MKYQICTDFIEAMQHKILKTLKSYMEYIDLVRCVAGILQSITLNCSFCACYFSLHSEYETLS